MTKGHISRLLQLSCSSFLNDSELREMRETAMTNRALDPAATRLNEEVYQLKTGQPVDAVRGLEDRLKVDAAKYYNGIARGVDGIKEELEQLAALLGGSERAEIMEWSNYIFHEPASEKMYINGPRDKDRHSERLADFVAHENAKAALLTDAEVGALRTYSTHLYRFMNNPLRDDERYLEGRACPLPVTTHFAVQGIKKLRALHAEETTGTVLWRGMRRTKVTADFMHQVCILFKSQLERVSLRVLKLPSIPY